MLKESVPYTHNYIGGCYFLIPRKGGYCTVTVEVQPKWDELKILAKHIVQPFWSNPEQLTNEECERHLTEMPAGWRPE